MKNKILLYTAAATGFIGVASAFFYAVNSNVNFYYTTLTCSIVSFVLCVVATVLFWTPLKSGALEKYKSLTKLKAFLLIGMLLFGAAIIQQILSAKPDPVMVILTIGGISRIAVYLFRAGVDLDKKNTQGTQVA